MGIHASRIDGQEPTPNSARQNTSLSLCQPLWLRHNGAELALKTAYAYLLVFLALCVEDGVMCRKRRNRYPAILFVDK
jgi:hypothetical protein